MVRSRIKGTKITCYSRRLKKAGSDADPGGSLTTTNLEKNTEEESLPQEEIDKLETTTASQQPHWELDNLGITTSSQQMQEEIDNLETTTTSQQPQDELDNL